GDEKTQTPHGRDYTGGWRGRSQREATKRKPEVRSQKPEEKAKPEAESWKPEESSKAKPRNWAGKRFATLGAFDFDFSSGFWLSTSGFAFSSGF
ncbi:MAG: hypothetical protein ABR524_06120, partial [Thermoanaerobaculia bacterium]